MRKFQVAQVLSQEKNHDIIHFHLRIYKESNAGYLHYEYRHVKFSLIRPGYDQFYYDQKRLHLIKLAFSRNILRFALIYQKACFPAKYLF